MKFENTEVWGFKHAIRGMRNPKNSWHLSDSQCDIIQLDGYDTSDYDVAEQYLITAGLVPEDFQTNYDISYSDYAKYENLIWDKIDKLNKNGLLYTNEHNETAVCAYIGPKDMKLMQTLIKAGPEHRKFLRQIFVSVDITAPLYIWKEFDTYKIGTVANSTSTMHKLTSAPITIECFEMDDVEKDLPVFDKETNSIDCTTKDMWNTIIDYCESLRKKYLETKNKCYWKELIRILPESWLQKRTVTMNYENILSMVHQRKNHKLNEWSGVDHPEHTNFINWAKSLPYADELLFLDEKENI